jgi:cation diffusion facilitator family transporter
MLSTAAVIIGLLAAGLGYPVADVLSAVFVALVMLYLSLILGKKAVLVLLDQAPDDGTIERIALIISSHPGVRGYHSLRARVSGHNIHVDVSVHMKPKISLEEAHAIAEDLEMKITDQCPDVKEVVVHPEPESPHDSGITMRKMFG